MASRVNSFRPLVGQFGSMLKAFQSSGAKFQVLKTIHPSDPDTLQEPSRPAPDDSPHTLFILDSSYNPPSVAHLTLAQSALRKDASDKCRKPHRMLLLFATLNADKAPAPASPDHRLTLMALFARDLLASLLAQPDAYAAVPIDIGVTTVPYYADKSLAIAEEGGGGGAAGGYPATPRHVHLIGFDTLTRFFAAKYYPRSVPPLAALAPFFDRGGHRLRVTLRPDGDYGTVDEQRAFWRGLADGELEGEGAERRWAEQVELVPPNPKAEVSSTRIRRAARAKEWGEVEELCTPGVAAWVRNEGLYDEGDG